MLSIRGAFALTMALTAPLIAPPTAPRPAHIILIRHGEKPADSTDPHLSPAGVRRAEQLVSFIASDPAIKALGTPVAVFATQTTRHDDGQRTQETVAPLAKSLKLAVQTPFLGKDYAALAQAILASPAFAGKTVIICWNHEFIPQLAAALGVRPAPSKWRASVFDQVDIITYSGKQVTLTTSRYGSRK